MTVITATLTGSDKQIAWAQDIRDRALAAWTTHRARMTDLVHRPEVPAIIARGDEIAAEMAGQSSAKWWIDSRGSGVDIQTMLISEFPPAAPAAVPVAPRSSMRSGGRHGMRCGR